MRWPTFCETFHWALHTDMKTSHHIKNNTSFNTGILLQGKIFSDAPGYLAFSSYSREAWDYGCLVRFPNFL